MKNLSKLLAATLAIAFVNPVKPTNANPAAIAIPAICAGTAGVGCILIGSAVIGGIVYYAWNNNKSKKRIITKKNGQVVKILDNPDDEEERPGDSGIWDEPIYAPTKKIAETECKNLARLYGVEFVEVKFDGATYRCYFRGGNG